MKFSENWLRQHVPTTASREQLVATLTAIGLEVEEVTDLGGALDGVVVAEIVSAEKHPEADRLQVCTVDAGGGETVQIVCGAPNARAGLKAPLAKVGAVLPGGMAITPAKLRGVESFGMLCSAKELGTDVDASGLLELPADAVVGQPMATLLGLPDASIEIKLTPNRADCFGVRGLAFDVAAASGSEVASFELEPVPAVSQASLPIELQAGADAPRYCGRVIEGVDASAPTPWRIAERLRRSGVRPVSLLVDVTQYVMLELGQPMHAFDRDSLKGGIAVRPARAGETLKLLDGRTVKLGLHTDAAHRFERGVDPELPRIALEYATRLILDAAGGVPGPVVEAALEAHLAQPRPILLRRDRLARVLGLAVADGEVARILGALGLAVESDPLGWRVTPPSRRFDLAIEEDLIEEVARIHGYDAIPTTLPSGAARLVAPSETRVDGGVVRRQLAARDFLEAINYAFVDASLLQAWGATGQSVALANPLSAELGVMRTSLLPGLVSALGRNTARQQSRVRMFEIGNVFTAQAGAAPLHTLRVAAVACGNAGAEQWGAPSRPVGFHDLKGDLESLAALSGARLEFRPSTPDWAHPGRSADVFRHDSNGESTRLGWVGQVHPRLARALEIDVDVVGFELDLEPLVTRPLPKAGARSRFPSVRRDLAFVVPQDVTWQALSASVREVAGRVLRDLVLFDVYQGKGVESGCKSLAMGLILQEESRTLTDQDVDAAVAAVTTRLQQAHAATIRG